MSRFNSVRNQLLEDSTCTARLQKSLEHWFLANDRRLPLILFSRLTDLSATPIEELASPPQRRRDNVATLLKLFKRATENYPPGITPPVTAGMSRIAL
jgi:hypothetical protein